MDKLNEYKNDWNFIDKCIHISISDKSCITGIVFVLVTYFPLFFNIYAFAKMTFFYKKLNFENGIILISVIEIAILQLVLTLSFDFLLQSFFFLQIITISLLIKKFSNLFQDMKSIFKNNISFILLNIINLGIFILYIVFIVKFPEKSFIINIAYKIIYLISVCFLSVICIFMNRLISQHKREYIENYNSFFIPSLLNKENKEISELESIDLENENENNEGYQQNKNNKDINKDTNKDINEIDYENIDYEKEKKQKGERFYHIKRKQNKCLYLINLICSIIELCFTIIRFFVLDKDFVNHQYKILPITYRSEIIYYVYILICLINISVIFFCFYYYIRRQYSYDTKVFKKNPSKKIIDEAFIEEQKMKDDENEMNEKILTNKIITRKKSSVDNFSDIIITKDDDEE